MPNAESVSGGDSLERLTLGILTAPELPEEIVADIVDDLSELLHTQVDRNVEWRLKTKTDPLSGTEGYSKVILDETARVKEQENWDLAISVTDLPIFFQRRLIVADADVKRNLAYLSMPALGAAPIKRRVREAVIQLVEDMHHGEKKQDRKAREGEHTLQATVAEKSEEELMSRRLAEWLSPISRQTYARENSDVDVRFLVESRVMGFFRMISGMVLANRPWTIFPAFKKVLAAAFATGAYGLIFPNLWGMSGAFSTTRLMIMMVMAILAMVSWIIAVHHLWEKTDAYKSVYLSRIYNAATVLTLGIGVMVYYAILFVLFFFAVLLFVPPDMLKEELAVTSVSLADFLVLTWLVASVATIVGAIGAGLENENTILKATYGHRQKLRRKQAKEEREEEESFQDGREKR